MAREVMSPAMTTLLPVAANIALVGAVAVGTGVSVLVAAVYLAVMMVADRSAMHSAVQRGRQRRGRSA